MDFCLILSSFFFFFWFPAETCRSPLLHAVCSELHWAAQLGVTMWGYGVNQGLWVAVETLRARPQANLNSQARPAYCWQQQPFSSVAFTAPRQEYHWCSFHFWGFSFMSKKKYFILNVSHVCSYVGCMSHSEKVLFIWRNESMCIKLPHAAIWTAAVGKRSPVIFDPLFSAPECLLKGCW